MKVVSVICLGFSAAGILRLRFPMLYSEGIRFVKLFRRLERRTTLWPNEMPSAITDSNEPAPVKTQT